jgi:hypothetical protein
LLHSILLAKGKVMGFILGSFSWLGKGDSKKIQKLPFYMGKRQPATFLAILFINAKEVVYIRNMLTEMGHPQPRTPIQMDNSTDNGFINNKIQAKRTKSMDMQHYWLKCREAQEQFRFYWRPGGMNLANYWMKHNPALHHQNMRAEFLTKLEDLETLCKNQAHHVSTSNLHQSFCQAITPIWR